MKRTDAFALAITAVVLIAAAAPAFGVHLLNLRDGRMLKGELVSASSQEVRFRTAKGDVETFPLSDVLSIHFKAPEVEKSQPLETPARIGQGTVIRVRVQGKLSSTDNNAGDRFFGVMAEDLTVGDVLVSAQGRRVYGRVRKVVRPRRGGGKATLEIMLTDITVGGKKQPLVTDFFGVHADGNGSAVKTGSARAPETRLPFFLDGWDVIIPPGTLIEFRVTQPVTVRAQM